MRIVILPSCHFLTSACHCESVSAMHRCDNFQNARSAEYALLTLQLLAAIANSEVANVTNMLGTALANLLPNRVGPDVLRYNYTQAFLPGLITAATGLSYEPCLISAGLTGAVVGTPCPPNAAVDHTAFDLILFALEAALPVGHPSVAGG